MRIFKNFRLLHRRTKSESDVSNLVTPTKLSFKRSDSQLVSSAGSAIASPSVFVPFELSLPSFDPNAELYSLCTPNAPSAYLHPAPVHSPTSDVATTLSTRINELEAALVQVRAEKELLERDLSEVQDDLVNMRRDLYDEMHTAARHGQRAVQLFSEVQKVEARYRRFVGLLEDIGVPRAVVDSIECVLTSNKDREEGEHVARQDLVNGVWGAAHDGRSLLSKSKPVAVGGTTPHNHRYQTALNLTLSVRREVKAQKKVTKFWKRLAQTDGKNRDIVTPSPSDVSSIWEELSPERRGAVEALIKRRHAAIDENREEGKDIFGRSSLNLLASSMLSRSRYSSPVDILAAPTESAHCVSNSPPTLIPAVPWVPLARSDLPPPHGNMASEMTRLSVAPFNLPSPPGPHSSALSLSSSLALSSSSSPLRASYSARPGSGVLGSVDLNILRSSAFESSEPHFVGQEEGEETEEREGQYEEQERTSSRSLAQNRFSVGIGHPRRRVPSAASRRSVSQSVVSARSSQSNHSFLHFSPPDPVSEASKAFPAFPVTASFPPSPPSPRSPKLAKSVPFDTLPGHGGPGDMQSSESDQARWSQHNGESAHRNDRGSMNGTPLDLLCSGNDMGTPISRPRPADIRSAVSSSNVSDKVSEPGIANGTDDNHRLNCFFSHIDSSSTGTLWSGPEGSTDSLFGVSASEASTSATPPQLTSGSSASESTPSPSSASASSPGSGSVKKVRSKLPIPKRLRRLSSAPPSNQNGGRTVGNLRGLKSSPLWGGSLGSISNGTAGSPTGRQGKADEKEKGGGCDKDTEGHDSFGQGSPVRALLTPVLHRRMTVRPRIVSGVRK